MVTTAKRLLSQYGMILVLLGLCVLFSALTLNDQVPTGDEATAQVVGLAEDLADHGGVILAVGAENTDSALFAEGVGRRLREAGFDAVRTVVGTPRDLRLALDQLQQDGLELAAIAVSGDALKWRVLDRMHETHPAFAGYQRLTPTSGTWPDFLKPSNLLAIVDRIVVIAVLAIGMTMVIITGGIDLSVGSLIALSAVVGTLVMKALGGLDAPAWAVALGFAAGISSCGLVGAVGGFLVARFKVAPFITTLAIMMSARGLAFMITGGFSVYQVPDGLTWLGQGRSLGIPNTVILLVVLYLAAHVFMAHTKLGRYIYAVGGNEEAARLSGVPVALVIFFVYVVSALAAGLGGCIQAAQIKTGTPTMGQMYELYVIAAVVVGGTSLSGGTGKVFGTLIGAFIIAVIQNGMNLLGIESYTQQVVLGGVILGAVLVDKARSSGGLRFLFRRK